jgi:hypothetical protein
MADEKISALPSAGALAGTEPLPIVQGGATKQTTVQDIADLAAGNQTLADTLVNGNVTGGTNVKVNNADAIELENTSLLKKGTYDFGGAGGISRICSVGYEDMWQAGIHHVFDNNGYIRESTNCFNYVPDNNFDDTLRFKSGSLWTLDDGTVYVCSDASTGAAVWAIGGIPNLQQVTDVGATTTVGITVDNGTESVVIKHDKIKIVNVLGAEAVIISPTLATTTNFEIPNKAGGTETFAMISDVGGLDLQVNGTPNVDQTLLNLIEGVNIDIADNGTGGVTITSLADRYSTSSVTSNTISNGSKTFTVDANLAYIPLQEVLIVYNPSNHMHATVTSYSGTTLVVDVKSHTGSGTYTSWVLNLDGVPVDAITGVGTANEIAYFTAGQVIASLAVATYPSLTELSYVKGVTSAIQTQLNAIKKPISSVGNGTAVTGVIVNTYSKGLLIAANSRNANDVVQIDFQVAKTGAAGNIQLRFYWNTTNDITTGSPILLGTSPNGAALWLAFSRLLSIEVANGTGNATKVAPTSVTTLATGYGTNTTATSTVAIDWTANGYLICSILNSSAADSSVCNMLKLL